MNVSYYTGNRFYLELNLIEWQKFRTILATKLDFSLFVGSFDEKYHDRYLMDDFHVQVDGCRVEGICRCFMFYPVDYEGFLTFAISFVNLAKMPNKTT